MAPYHHGDLPRTLLKSAETILERDGIGALTMRATAREAGVSHAAPAHHFGDLSGLLTELAASGFVRFHDHLEAEAATVTPAPGERLEALSRGYVEFAKAHPGLFQLMFRSERLDWSRPSLADAGGSAFALLTLAGDHIDVSPSQGWTAGDCGSNRPMVVRPWNGDAAHRRTARRDRRHGAGREH